MLEACRLSAHVNAIIVASSDKAYGSHDHLPYTESAALQGVYPYDVSKSCMDLIAQSYAKTYRMPIAIARCGNIYGGGDLHWSRIVPGTIRSLLNNECPIIRSDGKYVRGYIFVKDICKAYLALAKTVGQGQCHGQAFNFSCEQPMTVIALVEQITRLMQCEHLPANILNKAQGEIIAQFLSAQKANDILGWQPAYSLEQGLIETIAWYRRLFKKEDLRELQST